jgi:2-haloacid dehalogenase
MANIDTVVFDLGGVLIDWNPDYLYRTIFDDEGRMRDFLTRVCTPEWNEEQDGGRSLAEATELLIRQFPREEPYIRAYYDRWEEMLKGPISGTVDLLKFLRDQGRHRLYALTNWSAETFPVALRKYDFLHWFDGRLVSGEEKTRKPFREIYALLLNRFSIQPERAVFIDDNDRNLHEPARLGMKTIHFRSPDQLRQELRTLGIEIP